MPAKRFFQGDTLFREGDPADCVMRVLSGTVEVIRQVNGSEIVLGRVQTGQHLGEMGVIEGRPRRSASARAVGDVEVEIIGAEDFLNEVTRTPSLARELIFRLSQHLHFAEDRIVRNEQQGDQRPRGSGCDRARGRERRDIGAAPTVYAPESHHGTVCGRPCTLQPRAAGRGGGGPL